MTTPSFTYSGTATSAPVKTTLRPVFIPPKYANIAKNQKGEETEKSSGSQLVSASAVLTLLPSARPPL